MDFKDILEDLPNGNRIKVVEFKAKINGEIKSIISISRSKEEAIMETKKSFGDKIQILYD